MGPCCAKTASSFRSARHNLHGAQSMDTPDVGLDSVVRRLHECAGLNAPASPPNLERLGAAFAGAPDPCVLALYRDHDGSDETLVWRGRVLASRMMPVVEALEASAGLANVAGVTPGELLWLWTDERSNYAGVFTSGPLVGLVAILAHEEPRVAPRFRSAASFIDALLIGAGSSDAPSDIPDVACDFPATRDDASDVQRLRELSTRLLSLWRAEIANRELRRAWAAAALCLLPVADTNLALELLKDPDTWTPESAVALLEIRTHLAAVPELESLARDGTPNGDGAAIRALVRFGTPEAREALARLDDALSGRKRSLLDMYRRVRIAPAHW